MDDEIFLQLKAFFPQVSLTEQEAHHFKSLWSVKTFNQYDLITEAGSVERYFYFVLEGVQAIYILNEKGEKVVLGFSYSGSPSGVFDSFIAQSPSLTFLEALKPSKMLAITLSNYQSLFENYPDFHKWGHQFFQDILFGRLYREVELLTLTAEQRYVAFMQRCPEELKVIPQKYLASYLNMKPETFSRLRASVMY
ncbi:Crp/Fnr family transcriptional regulator [Flagellimonas allohymeniacidonis]|uniref:Crp/Fnr family transcriptional regulator n=1 Tax=Flagellimonas allohymeniacidonis TaxID=2517819 RepID=A0A4Q8QGG0_9FLAO|nr:Crp/Fnr family transcriptional regulator [Allomuricauda hymeniacidonis]TAI47683.1 Crp/Fnr family transcriptional regulator [Allomuricauda hymeniacidonis]